MAPAQSASGDNSTPLSFCPCRKLDWFKSNDPVGDVEIEVSLDGKVFHRQKCRSARGAALTGASMETRRAGRNKRCLSAITLLASDPVVPAPSPLWLARRQLDTPERTRAQTGRLLRMQLQRDVIPREGSCHTCEHGFSATTAQRCSRTFQTRRPSSPTSSKASSASSSRPSRGSS